MKTAHRLKIGESLQVTGTVTVVKCGLHSDGSAPAIPTVLIEVDGEVVADEPAPEASEQGAGSEPAGDEAGDEPGSESPAADA